MNELFFNEVDIISQDFPDRKKKTFHINSLKNLSERDDLFENENFVNSLSELTKILKYIDEDYRSNLKMYNIKFKEIKTTLANDFDLHEEGTILSKNIALGLALGLIFGSLFASSNPAFVGIGLPLGLVFGTSIGTSKEKEAKKAGKIY